MTLAPRLGGMPIMTKSRACHLSGLSRTGLVALKEEANEMGGYFICNGLERIIRCIIAQRRHYIMGLRRGEGRGIRGYTLSITPGWARQRVDKYVCFVGMRCDHAGFVSVPPLQTIGSVRWKACLQGVHHPPMPLFPKRKRHFSDVFRAHWDGSAVQLY
eukprot:1154081-Pelagomonas_calceolata.AAC.1